MLPENGQPLGMNEVIVTLAREFRRSLLLYDLNKQTADAYDNKAERKHFHRCHVQPSSPIGSEGRSGDVEPQNPPSYRYG